MRQIKASEVKPGMKIEWTSGGVLHRLTPNYIGTFRSDVTIFGPDVPKVTGYNLCTEGGGVQWVSVDQAVTVLAEAQPEEPTTFGARVVVDGRRFLRSPEEKFDIQPWLEENEGIWRDWDELIILGPVQVVPDQGWTVPDVPKPIEEWDTWEDVPEGVVVTAPGLFCHYRKNQGVVEFSDAEGDPDWTEPHIRSMSRRFAPWTRVTDA